MVSVHVKIVSKSQKMWEKEIEISKDPKTMKIIS